MTGPREPVYSAISSYPIISRPIAKRQESRTEINFQFLQ